MNQALFSIINVEMLNLTRYNNGYERMAVKYILTFQYKLLTLI